MFCLPTLESPPCPAPPGSHPGPWTAPSEPSRRCLTLPAPPATGTPTRRGCPTFGPNMAPTTRTEEREWWPIGTHLLDLQVRMPSQQIQNVINGLIIIVVMCLLNWTSSSPSVGRSLLPPTSGSDGGSQLGAPCWQLRTDGEQRRRLRSVHAVYCLHARRQCARFIVPIAIQHRGGEKPVNYHSKIDADIDSLTSMLADLDNHTQDSGAQVFKERFIYLPSISHSHECLTLILHHAHQLYDNVPYNKYLSGDHYKPSHQSSASPQGRPSMGYPAHHHHHQGQYHPVPPYPSEPQSPQYPTSHQQDYYAPSTPKPYPQPVPASYTTASTPTGPRFSVQVKTAQPVTYSQTGRQAEQAYTPPPPRQHVPRPPPHAQAGLQGWYPSHQPQEMHSEAGGFKGSGQGSGGRLNTGPLSKRGMENVQPAQSPAYQSSKVEQEIEVANFLTI